jgi:hypothetical protein
MFDLGDELYCPYLFELGDPKSFKFFYLVPKNIHPSYVPSHITTRKSPQKVHIRCLLIDF